ncbi:hypothetical protein MMC13_005553 [Lambiella insularis]|nr:hypothetical protein [Lambiella insularis]
MAPLPPTEPSPPSMETFPPSTETLPAPTQTHTSTIRSLPYTYFHLTLLTPSSLSFLSLPSNSTNAPPPNPTPTLDDLTFRTHLTSALTSHLGLTGSAIPIDILKTAGSDVWVRVAREDAPALGRALAAWRAEGWAWRVRGRGGWLGGMGGGERGVWEG